MNIWQSRSRRDPLLLERDLARHRSRNSHLFPQFELTPDLSRGELRLAAEAMLASLNGANPPPRIIERAMATLAIIAKG